MAISLNQLLIHSRNTVQVCQRIHVLLASSTHRYTLCGKSLSRAWSDQPLDLLGHVNKVAAPYKDRGVGAGIYPPKHRGMGNKCAEISLTCKHRDHTFISPRPAGTFNKQNTLLRLLCTAHWLLQPAGKYLMRRIKIFHINYIPVAGGLGGVSWTVAWCWPAHALPPVPLLLLMVRY